MSANSTSVPLLPAPSSQSLEELPSMSVNAATPMKLDHLGPMVVNSDGTLSRIANWENMTEAERERTMRVIAVRNKARLAMQQKDGPDTASTPLSATES